MPYIPDKDNICIKCKHTINYGQIHPSAFPEPVAWIICNFTNLCGANKGQRRTCSAFEPKEVREK